MIRAKTTVSECMRAVLVAHLSLRAREREKNGGALHGALHPSFDRADMCSNLAYQLPVITNRADTGRAFPKELWEEAEGSSMVREGGFEPLVRAAYAASCGGLYGRSLVLRY